jgi:glucokinase
VPIVGIQKKIHDDGRVLITGSFEAAQALVEAGAAIVAIDCTSRGRASGAYERVRRIQQELGVPVVADIATLEEAEQAVNAGVDAVLSTMRGYTDDTAHVTQFEPAFIRELVSRCPVPVIAEGRINSPREAAAAIREGAWAVIVGTAITRPRYITRWYAQAVEQASHSEKRYYVGVDLGGTNTKSGLVSSDGELLFHFSTPTPAQAGRESLLINCQEAVANIMLQAGSQDLPVSAIGVATAGWVNNTTGTIAYATENLPGWTGTRVAGAITDSFKLPVAVENDANALAVAERHFGIGRRFDDFVVITLGTGVGGGCYIGGNLNRGAHFFANAFGHIPLVPDGIACTCGRNGCLEVYANARALLRYAGDEYESAEHVIRAANLGNNQARMAIRTLAKYLARGCASLVGMLDPQALIFSGGLAIDNPELIEALKQELGMLVPVWEERNVAVETSALGYFGGVLGAAAVAIEAARTL